MLTQKKSGATKMQKSPNKLQPGRYFDCEKKDPTFLPSKRKLRMENVAAHELQRCGKTHKTAKVEKPDSKQKEEVAESNNLALKYGASCSQGCKPFMEDRRTIVLSLPGTGFLKKWSFFGVFDGHLGQSIATLCSEKLVQTIVETYPFVNYDNGSDGLEDVSALREGIRTAFMKLDVLMEGMIEDRSGATACVILVSPTHIYFANCGDSRAIFYWDDLIKLRTEDHKPRCVNETQRILWAGGSVKISNRDSKTLRINGNYAVSRSFGDYILKKNAGKAANQQMMIAEPEIVVHSIPPQGKGFIIIVSDGVHAKLDTVEIVTYIAHNLKLTLDLDGICDRLIEGSMYKKGKDNMTAILVAMRYTRKSILKSEQRDNWNLDWLIKKRMREILQKDEKLEFGSIVSQIERESKNKMPPGLGIYSKINFMLKYFRNWHQLRASNLLK